MMEALISCSLFVFACARVLIMIYLSFLMLKSWLLEFVCARHCKCSLSDFVPEFGDVYIYIHVILNSFIYLAML